MRSAGVTIGLRSLSRGGSPSVRRQREPARPPPTTLLAFAAMPVLATLLLP